MSGGKGSPSPRGAGLGPAEERIAGFDLARGAAVLFMIAIHVMRHWGEPAVWATPIGWVITVAGGPFAAPVFMVLMGASLPWWRVATTRALLVRGGRLLALALALNLARGTGPLVLGQAVGVIGPGGIGDFTPWGLAISVDILALAGSSLVAVALLGPLVPPGWPWLAPALLVFGSAPLVRDTVTGIALADAALGVLWRTGGTVFYPLIPWGGFVFVGLAIGSVLRRSADRPALLRRVAVVGVALTALGLASIARFSPPLDARGYWELPPILVPAILGPALAWIGLADPLARRFPESAPVRLCAAWSRRVTRIYVAHWLVVAWGIGVVGYLALDLPTTLVAIVLVVAAVDLVGREWSAPMLRLARRPG